MEAKDTVMIWKQIVECSHNPVLELRERDICLAQAEISEIINDNYDADPWDCARGAVEVAILRQLKRAIM